MPEQGAAWRTGLPPVPVPGVGGKMPWECLRPKLFPVLWPRPSRMPHGNQGPDYSEPGL